MSCRKASGVGDASGAACGTTVPQEVHNKGGRGLIATTLWAGSCSCHHVDVVYVERYPIAGEDQSAADTVSEPLRHQPSSGRDEAEERHTS